MLHRNIFPIFRISETLSHKQLYVLLSLSEVVGTHVVLDCKWIITVFYTQYRSPPPNPINVAPTKTHQTWREMGHNIEQGAGGIDVLLKFKGFVASVPRLLKLIV
jgi:hypothetical protein